MQQIYALFVMVLALIGAGPAFAQQSSTLSLGEPAASEVISSVLTIDRARVLRDSAYGRRLLQEDIARVEALEAENKQIEAALSAEEQEITLKRAEMDVEAFRQLADAFDQKVQRTEQVQLNKDRALRQAWAKDEDTFLRRLGPVLERVMIDTGASVILERSAVYASATQIDITDRVIALLDETIGDGAGAD